MAAPKAPITSNTKLSQMIEADSIFADIDIGISDLVTVSDSISNLLGPSNTTIKRQVRMMTQTLTALHSKMEEAMRKLSKLRSHQDLIRSKKTAINNKISLEKAAASTSNKRKSPSPHTVRIQEIIQPSKQPITPARTQPKRMKASKDDDDESKMETFFASTTPIFLQWMTA